MRIWFEILYIPSFFLLHASVFLGTPSVYPTVLITMSAIISAVLFLKKEQNSKIIEALIITGLFYSNLIPPWSGMLFMLILILMPDGLVNSRFSFAFRSIVFPALTLAFLSGWNAFGLAVLLYFVSLMIFDKIEVRALVHKAREN